MTDERITYGTLLIEKLPTGYIVTNPALHSGMMSVQVGGFTHLDEALQFIRDNITKPEPREQIKTEDA